MASCPADTLYADACANSFGGIGQNDIAYWAVKLQLLYEASGESGGAAAALTRACASGFLAIAEQPVESNIIWLAELCEWAGGDCDIATLQADACVNGFTPAVIDRSGVELEVELLYEAAEASGGYAAAWTAACANGFAAAANDRTARVAIALQLVCDINGGSCNASTLLSGACGTFNAIGYDVAASAAVALQLLCDASGGSLPEPVQSFVDRSGITDETQIAAVLALYNDAVAHGWWDKCDLIYPFVGGNATAHAQNLKSTNFTITWNGTVTHDANGITGDGSTGYGDTGYDVASSGQFAQDSGHLSIYRRTIGTLATYHIASSNSNFLRLISFSSSTQGRLNAIANSNLANSHENGYVMGRRVDSANQTVHVNALSLASAIASVAPAPGDVLIVLAAQLIGVPSSFTDANLAAATCGSGITAGEYTDMAADWQTFQTTLGRQV